jgi:tyrosine-protein phosphatase SIW14
MRIPLSFTPAALVLAIAIPSWSANLQVSGIPNFHKVNDKVFRGGQPFADGWNSLAKLGIKTIVDLRRPNEHDTIAEERAVKALGMRYVNVPMNGIVAPTEEQIIKVLALLSATDGPVFVHCRRGADRTGTVLACYRMGHDKWDNKKAFREAKTLGMSWMELGMKRYIMAYRAPVREGVPEEVAAAPTTVAAPGGAVPTPAAP